MQRRAVLLAICSMTGPLLLIPVRAVAQQCDGVLCYAGNRQSGGYGAMTSVSTPAGGILFPSLLPGLGVSNWVSTPPPYWMQAGWRFDQGDVVPRNYWEYCRNLGGPTCDYHVSPSDFDRFLWGETHNYIVDYETRAGFQAWCAYVDGFQVQCADLIRNAPTVMETLTEIHQSSMVLTWAQFTRAQIQFAENGSYYGQDLSGLYGNFPYLARQTGAQDFLTYHAGTYLPFIIRS
jgi:hypothetical protein